ncbi:MAG: hypothetical protein KF785_05955 [Gemmatimonadales bacterium]|nr:hypothetical protein [Gemmatimonadales bacterium]
MSDLMLGLVVGLAAGVLVGMALLALGRGRREREVRRDAVQRSEAVIAGKVAEQLLPYLPGFAFNPKDVRFLGSPVDLVVFDGLSSGALERVVFVEVKTGEATLTRRERQLRDIVAAGGVEWIEWRVALPARSAAPAQE